MPRGHVGNITPDDAYEHAKISTEEAFPDTDDYTVHYVAEEASQLIFCHLNA